MNKSERIKDITFLAISFVAILISSLQILGILDSITWFAERSDNILLFLLSTLCIYIAIERQNIRQHDQNINDRLENTKDTLIHSLGGIETKNFTNADKAFKYLSDRFEDVNERVLQIAIAPTPNMREEMLKRYRNSFEKILKEDVIKYTCISEQSYAPRWSKYTEYAQKYNKFHLKYLKIDANSLPTLNFFVFDDEEVFMRHPHDEGENEHYISVKHPSIVSLFITYYNKIFNVSTYYKN